MNDGVKFLACMFETFFFRSFGLGGSKFRCRVSDYKSEWKPDCVFEPWVERSRFVSAIAVGVIVADIVEQTL